MSLQLREPTMGPKPPSLEEMAIISAVVEQMWPRPTVEEDVKSTAESVWKFANRWWGSTLSNRRRPTRPSAF